MDLNSPRCSRSRISPVVAGDAAEEVGSAGGAPGVEPGSIPVRPADRVESDQRAKKNSRICKHTPDDLPRLRR